MKQIRLRQSLVEFFKNSQVKGWLIGPGLGREKLTLDLAKENLAGNAQLIKCLAPPYEIGTLGECFSRVPFLSSGRPALRQEPGERSAAVEHALRIFRELTLHRFARLRRIEELIDVELKLRYELAELSRPAPRTQKLHQHERLALLKAFAAITEPPKPRRDLGMAGTSHLGPWKSGALEKPCIAQRRPECILKKIDSCVNVVVLIGIYRPERHCVSSQPLLCV